VKASALAVLQVAVRGDHYVLVERQPQCERLVVDVRAQRQLLVELRRRVDRDKGAVR
jgi:hypothetical protein